MVYENKKGKFPLIKDSFVATRKQRKFSWKFSFSSTMRFFLSQVEGIEASSSASRNLIVSRRMVRGGGFFSSPFNSFRIASGASESLESKQAMKKSSKRLRQRRSAEKSGAVRGEILSSANSSNVFNDDDSHRERKIIEKQDINGEGCDDEGCKSLYWFILLLSCVFSGGNGKSLCIVIVQQRTPSS